VHARIRYFTIAFLIASVPVALMILSVLAEPRPAGSPSLGQMIVLGAIEWYPWVVIAAFIDRLVRRSRSRRVPDRLRIVAAHLAQWAAFTMVHRTLVMASSAVLFPEEATTWSRAVAGGAVPNAILYSAIVAGFTIAEARRRQTEVAERLRAEVAEARLDALRQQLNPHFLFNTLNHIVMQLRTRETESALRMLLALSDLLRDVLKERSQLIPLADEVRMLERYFEIERERFGDRLHAEMTLEPKALAALVPTLILQPLIENAMRHGISEHDGRCRLTVTARVDGDQLALDVRDAGPGMPAPDATTEPGIGLRNTAERLKYLYGAGHTFDLRSQADGGLLVSLRIPFRRS
jgi:two-component system LytT family sensor kinase